MRRTTSIDSLRPDGLEGPVHIVGHGRDLRSSESTAEVLDSVTLEARVDYLQGMVLTDLRADPALDPLAPLIGDSVRRGFRSRVQALVPDHADRESALFQLLDDLPVTTMVSGHALTTGPRPPLEPRSTHPTQDVCAGWRTGGTIMLEMSRSGRSPVVVGPVVAPLETDADPLAWHELSELPPDGMRRSRRTDLWFEDGLVRIETFFRDSHRAGSDPERAVHEYSVSATYDPELRVFTSAAAVPGALPWQECPAAVASASSVIGRSADRLRELARTTGIGTCTHLTDQLRSLSAVPALVSRLRD